MCLQSFMSFLRDEEIHKRPHFHLETAHRHGNSRGQNKKIVK